MGAIERPPCLFHLLTDPGIFDNDGTALHLFSLGFVDLVFCKCSQWLLNGQIFHNSNGFVKKYDDRAKKSARKARQKEGSSAAIKAETSQNRRKRNP